MSRARTDAQKEDRRSAIIRAALDEFFERGFAAARIDDIAKRAGLAKGTVYLYFASKEALFEAIIDALARPNFTALETLVNEAPSFRAALEQFAAFAPTLVTATDMPKLMKVMVGDSHSFPEIVADYRATVLDRMLGAVAGLIARGQASGELRAADPNLAARIMVAPVVVSALWQAVFGRTGDPQPDVQALVALHVEGLWRALRAEKVRVSERPRSDWHYLISRGWSIIRSTVRNRKTSAPCPSRRARSTTTGCRRTTVTVENERAR